ncbi:Thioredoxin [Streptomyces sp. enrichment culture]|uniref:thioredoxin family protein n=1 Tax=Streptomyces sp. enrichment culture TaxID=1795815 RepID=UPI003F55495E
MAQHVQTLTEADFDQHVGGSPQPVLVDFWAEDCSSCKALFPLLEELALEHTGTLRVGAVRLDDAPGLARRFDIMKLPTLMVFVDGEPVKRIVDIQHNADLVEALEEFLR